MGKMLGMTTNHSWNHAAFDPNYQQQLNQFGITEEKYKMIISRLNPILVGFAPFTRDSETYITELRKHLTKCNQDFPQSKWSLQIHKFATELSSSLPKPSSRVKPSSKHPSAIETEKMTIFIGNSCSCSTIECKLKQLPSKGQLLFVHATICM